MTATAPLTEQECEELMQLIYRRGFSSVMAEFAGIAMNAHCAADITFELGRLTCALLHWDKVRAADVPRTPPEVKA